MLQDFRAERVPSDVHKKRNPLFPREIELLELMVDGRPTSAKRIAAELCISRNTVKAHLRNIFDKLGVEDKTQAVAKALRAGYIHLDVDPRPSDDVGH